MIVSRLQGGLGNQLFQYAAGRSVALRTGSPLCLDTSLLDRRLPGLTPRTFELRPYRLPYRLLSRAERTWLRLDLRSRTRLPARWLHSHWGAYDVEPQLSLKAPAVLEGYWQSARYFAGIEAELRESLRDRYDAGEPARRLRDELSRGVSVSVHVRRGDFITNANAASHHVTCSEDYYRRAGEIVGGATFYVFTDDADWARAHLSLPGQIVLVTGQPGISHHDELYLMSHCTHHIIANSSFSWWGAWLNPAPGKIVVAPRRWLRNADAEPRDLIPPEWTRIDN
jgi:hypothetical protein